MYNHNHNKYNLPQSGFKPHTHPISDIVGLQTALDNRVIVGQQSKTLWVNSNHTNALDTYTRTQAIGRQDRPFLTLASAFAVALAGDTIQVVDMSFTTQLTWNKNVNIILNNSTWTAPSGLVAIQWGTGTTTSATNRILLILNNSIITSSQTSVQTVNLSNLAVFNTIVMTGNSRIEHTANSHAIQARESNIFGGHFKSNSGHALFCTNSANCVVENVYCESATGTALRTGNGTALRYARNLVAKTTTSGTAFFQDQTNYTPFFNCQFFASGSSGFAVASTNGVKAYFEDCILISASSDALSLGTFADSIFVKTSLLKGAINCISMTTLQNTNKNLLFVGSVLYAGSGLIFSESFHASDTSLIDLSNCYLNKAFAPVNPAKFNIGADVRTIVGLTDLTFNYVPL